MFSPFENKTAAIVSLANIADKSQLINFVCSLMRSLKHKTLSSAEYSELGEYMEAVCKSKGIDTKPFNEEN